NATLRELREQLAALHPGETQLDQPFFHCWFLSVPQLLVALDDVRDAQGLRMRSGRRVTSSRAVRTFTTTMRSCGVGRPQISARTLARLRARRRRTAWDMVGPEFAGRHLQYEKFHAGASFIVRNHSYRETDWSEFNALVENFMASY